MVKAALLGLLLAAGPLQAQIVYFCSVMQEALEDSCCCDDQEQDRASTAAPDCMPAESAPACCETLVELAVDPDAGAVAVPSYAARDSGPDPPPLIVFPAPDAVAVLAPPTVAPYGPGASPLLGAGTATYLVTQRLRI